MVERILLDDDAIASLVAKAPGWERQGMAMHRVFEFKDFSEAFAFMTRVAMIAESIDHHPDWSNVWNRVEMTVTTHDPAGLTSLDAQFIEAVDRIAATG